MVLDKTLYDRLEVAPDVSQDEIKKKGKKLLVKWHPDKHPNNVEMATKKFQEIQEALSVLENPEKRKMYDDFGMDALKGDIPQGHPFGGGNPFGGGGNPFGGGFPFADMFGPGFAAQFNMFPQREERKENVIERMKVQLAQIYKEETVELKYKHKVFCTKCSGEGTNDGSKSECKDCNGKGVRQQTVRMGPMIQTSLVPCNGCKGKGRQISPDKRCEECKGECNVEKEKVVNIPLKNGLQNGIKLQLEGRGHHFKNTKTDLIVLIEVDDHPVFKRSNSDLVIEVDLKLYQALFGFNKVVEHLDGRKLLIQHTGKTEFGTIRKISEEGMKDLRTGMKGDLIIKFNIKLPDIKNETLIKALTLIDKSESKREKELLKDEKLVKTVMTDVTQYKEEKHEESDDDSDMNSNGSNDFNEDGSPGECRQQ